MSLITPIILTYTTTLENQAGQKVSNIPEPDEVSLVELTIILMDLKQDEQTTSLGSASWNGVDRYEVGDESYERAIAFLAMVKWDVLASLSSNLRNGIPCKFRENFSMGHFNMVRHLVFEDGINWVARLKMPGLESAFGCRDALNNASILEVEVASMRFFRYAIFGSH